MSPDDKYLKKGKLNHPDENTDDESGESGHGGKSGQIEFRDFLSTNEHVREDLLSPQEKKRLLASHKETHALRVKNQKELRAQRKALKEGKIKHDAYRQGLMGTGMNAHYKAHPVLGNKAQFTSTDRQLNALPTEHVADTYNEQRDKLEYQYRLRNMPKQAPTFNPKPQFR